METACLHLRGKAKSSHLSTRCCQERQLLASKDVDVKIVMVNYAKVDAFILNLCLDAGNLVFGMCFPRIKTH